MRAPSQGQPILDEAMTRIGELQDFVADLQVALSGLGVDVGLILGDPTESLPELAGVWIGGTAPPVLACPTADEPGASD
jgi:hypothetical protein